MKSEKNKQRYLPIVGVGAVLCAGVVISRTTAVEKWYI